MLLRSAQTLLMLNNKSTTLAAATTNTICSGQQQQKSNGLSNAFSTAAPQLQEIVLVQDGQHPNVYNVQLNRPDKRNTFTTAFWRELKTAFDYLADEPSCRAVVLSANGPSFCAGIDLREGVKEMLGIVSNDGLDAARKARLLRQLIQHCQDSYSSLERCPKPVIAAIHAHCIGAGINLVSCADVRYASSDAIFSIREVDIGLAADVGILQRIHLIAGNDSWARELAFTGRDVSAVEAQKFGLVSRVLNSSADCREAAFSLARQIASKSPIAVQGTKMAMNYARSHGVEDSLEWIRNWNAVQLQTTDIGASVQAKMSKAGGQQPQFDDVFTSKL